MGHKVVSRWLVETHDPNVTICDFSDLELSEMSDRDMRDIKDADVLAHFTGENERGGAIEECGISLGMRLEGRDVATFIIGDRRNIFDYSSMVDHFPTEEEFLKWAEKEAGR